EIDGDKPTPRGRVTRYALNTKELAVHKVAKARPTSREKPSQSADASLHHDAIRFGKVRFGQFVELDRVNEIVHRDEEKTARWIVSSAGPIRSAGGIRVDDRSTLARRREHPVVP